MAIADKLLYLDQTKSLLRDAINGIGGGLSADDPFRQYAGELLKDQATLRLDFDQNVYGVGSHPYVRDDTKTFSDLITFTRSTGGGVFNQFGLYEWLAADVPRIDHEPATLGSSTDSITMGYGIMTINTDYEYPVGGSVVVSYDANNYMVGKVLSSSSAAVTLNVVTVVGSGTYSAWTLIVRLGLLVEESRTNLLLNSAVLATQTRTVTAVSHTLSFYGTGSVTLSGAATGTILGTSDVERVSLTFTPSAGSLTLTVAGDVLLADLQAGTFPTSHIPTAGAAVTRAVDAANVLSAPWFNPVAGTAYVEFNSNSPSGYAFDFYSTTNTDRLIIRNNAASVSAITSVGGAVVSVSNGTGAQTTRAAAVVYGGGDLSLSVYGGLSSSSSGTPSDIDALSIGNTKTAAAGFVVNGHIKSISYIPRRLTNDELQAITQ